MAHPGPFVIDFRVEPEENVYPMVPPGAALAEQIEAPRQEEALSNSARRRATNTPI